MPRKSRPKSIQSVELGIVLQRYLDKPPKLKDLDRPKKWSREHWAQEFCISVQAIGNWLNGENLPANIEIVIDYLFGNEVEKYQAEIDELRSLYRRAIYKRIEERSSRKGVQFPVRSQSKSLIKNIYTDVSFDLAVLNYSDIDNLPVEDEWIFDSVSYGDGVQKFAVPGSNLYWQNPTVRLSNETGELRSLSKFFPQKNSEIQQFAGKTEIFFPRKISVTGIKQNDTVVRLFACTDIPYPQGIDDSDQSTFTTEALLGLGGIAAFLDPEGNLRPRSHIEMGNGLGCAVALVSVAYVRRKPRYRSPYCLMIRKGIRYPDDVWLSPTSNMPIMSRQKNGTTRFIFQSRENKGCSTDMFAANYNGSQIINLNEGDESAWDGFADDNGRSLVKWDGNKVTFASMVKGNGFKEAITREDAPE